MKPTLIIVIGYLSLLVSLFTTKKKNIRNIILLVLSSFIVVICLPLFLISNPQNNKYFILDENFILIKESVKKTDSFLFGTKYERNYQTNLNIYETTDYISDIGKGKFIKKISEVIPWRVFPSGLFINQTGLPENGILTIEVQSGVGHSTEIHIYDNETFGRKTDCPTTVDVSFRTPSRAQIFYALGILPLSALTLSLFWYFLGRKVTSVTKRYK